MRPDAPLDPPATVVELDGGPLSFTETGSGPTVVAVHGLPATGRDFRWLDAAIAGRARFVRMDLPGFGASPLADHRYHSVAEMADTVCKFCEAIDATDAVLLGHSMGGPIAALAAAKSSRVSALALVNSAGPILHRGIFPRTYGVLLGLIDLHRLLRTGVLAATKPIARAIGFSKRISDDEFVLATRLCAAYRPGETRTALSELNAPVLIAWAKDDPSVEPRVSEALLACVGDPTRALFETGGHNLQSTRAVELADALMAWIEGATQTS